MKQGALLPQHFRITGLIIIVLAFIVPVTLGMLHILPHLRGWKEELSKTAFLLGLFLVAFTRQKIEDEFVTSCRLTSMFNAFIVSVIFYLGATILSLLQIQVVSYSGFRVLFFQVFSYLVYFHLAIRGGMFGHAE
jgi:hypothetical protein